MTRPTVGSDHFQRMGEIGATAWTNRRKIRYGRGVAVVLTIRPKVAELVFQVYGRPLHPELFSVFQSQTYQRAEYRAKIDITDAGHVITWSYAGLTLTEVAASAHHPLPTRRRLINCPMRGQRTDAVECAGKVRYETSFQLEVVEPELFWAFQAELASDGRRGGMLQQFRAGDRISLGALSFVNAEARSGQFLVQAFHTFPDDYAIVKTQSLFQLP